jgi:hypothetical protein
MARKHVVFFGAGCSISCGYPAADGLRLLMLSKKVRDKVKRDHGLGNPAHLDEIFLEVHKEAIAQFELGRFATIDVYCKLATGTKQAKNVPILKQIMRLVLGIHDSMEYFSTCDYSRLVNLLFARNQVDLREDISILSYNYDPCLDYLLTQAVKTRKTSLGWTNYILKPKFLMRQLADFGLKRTILGAMKRASAL